MSESVEQKWRELPSWYDAFQRKKRRDMKYHAERCARVTKMNDTKRQIRVGWKTIHGWQGPGGSKDEISEE